MEGNWTERSMLNIPLIVKPVMFDKGTITGRVDTGSIDTVSAVDMDDNVWKEESSGTVAVVSIDIDDCEKPLEVQLDIGKDCTPEH